MVSDARICIRRAELSDARIRSRKLYRDGTRRTGGIGRAAGIRRAQVSREGGNEIHAATPQAKGGLPKD